ncbi:MAG: hypothetical protein AAGH74_08475 [Pseudomonadota bacterium]
MRSSVRVLLGAATLHLIGWSGVAYGQEVWLEKGAVTLTLETGQEVDLEEGNYLNCDSGDENEPKAANDPEQEGPCQILPLALAPALPASSVLGGLAVAPLAAGPLTVVGPVIGASIGAAIAGGVAASVVGGDSTPTTTPNTN